MAPGSQCARFATITSRCKQHINTGAAVQLAAVKQPTSLDHLIGKQMVSVPQLTCFMPLLIKLPPLPADA